MAELLIELFSEEIPARMQRRAADDLKRLVTDGLVGAGLTYANAAAFYTPRRLTLVLGDVPSKSPPAVSERKGPKVDAPQTAIDGFLRSTGLTLDALEVRDDKKGQVYFARLTQEGRFASDVIAEVLEGVIRNFPWPKSMRWADGTLRWVRPLHSILCILSDEANTQVVPIHIGQIKSGNQTRGHRFMAPAPFAVKNFDDYEAKLERAFVKLRAQTRADSIWQDASNAAFALGLKLVKDDALLQEVAGLVEWPVVLMGKIDAAFMDLPPEVLRTSMKEHQKFFSVKNPKTQKIERFITVANRTTADQGASILKGNQKVLAARLSDAKFFWENDLRVAQDGMKKWQNALADVTFHAKLGTQAQRSGRLQALSRECAAYVGAQEQQAMQAAKVAKADLASEMVYEFPELQGIMGRYYAQKAGLADEVAQAVSEHYAPLGPSDSVPSAPVSVAVALADKLDLLAGFWVIDEKPTGSKDPFALRRAALGVIRLVLENEIQIPLLELSQIAIKQHSKSAENGHIAQNLLEFMHERLKVFLRERDMRHDVIDACIAMPQNDDLYRLVQRAKALGDILTTEDGENLIQAYRRAVNILTQAEQQDGVEYAFGADLKLAQGAAEKELFAALDKAEKTIKPATQKGDFAAAMSATAALRRPIDAFFDAAKINDTNSMIRRNRLNLLSRIRDICALAADLSKLQG